MATIGRIGLAAANATQETNAALAHLTFDFSLVKVQAPSEYGPLGSSLSKKRRRNAEDNSMHTTAQQLGALFADDLPDTPSLIQAYGLRASQIAENPKVKPQATASYGAFAEYAGADGTSIWAAATSRRGALAAHLLACLLSKVWSPSEATSIWSELVSTRQAILHDRVQEEHFHFNFLTAARIEISRERLAEWDASARSVSAYGSQSANLHLLCNANVSAWSTMSLFDLTHTACL